MSTCAKCGAALPPQAVFCGDCGAPVSSAPSTDDTWTVGADPACDIVLSHPSVSRRHLEVRKGDNGDLHIRDLGSANGTYINARRIQTATVGLHDSLQLGLLPVPVRSLLREFVPTPSQVGRTLTIGRTSANDLTLDLPVVSSQHAEIRASPKGLEIRDTSSTNGTYVNGHRTQGWALVPREATLHLGSYRVLDSQRNQWLQALQTGTPTGAEDAVKVTLGARILVGRDPQCDIVIDHPTVSWQHARLETTNGRTTLADLKSTNGTFVNGSRIQRSNVTADDEIMVGRVPLRLEQGRVVAPRQYRGEVRLDVDAVCRDLTKGPAAGKRILDSVSLSVFPGELVALMGPSGAGKTTLLEILTGQRAPSSGKVFLNGNNLHQNRDRFADSIGYVPQEDVMHRDLTVFEVLYNAARLRLPGDIPNTGIRAHVDKLIGRMGLSHIRDSTIGGEQVRGISGGQRKRVNIALELIDEPPLLFLDEPTSGLDATSTLEVLQILRNLADDGTTIIMTIHQPRIEAFRMVDNLLLLAKGGLLAYYGPATPHAADYFATRSPIRRDPQTNPADYVLDTLDPADSALARAAQSWQSDYRSSDLHRSYVTSRRTGTDHDLQITATSRGGRAGRSVASQMVTLTQRYALRKRRDTDALVLQALQPLVVGVLLALTFYDVDWPQLMPSEGLQASNKAHAIIFLVAATAFWLGCSNVARELVAERAVFRRESMAGVSTFAYLGSKVLVQLGIGTLQVGTLAALIWTSLALESSVLMAFPILILTLLSGTGVGMLVSATVRTEVTAISTLPLLLLPQLILAGYLQLYRELSEALQILSSLMPIRWAFEALLQTEYEAVDGDVLYDLEATIGFTNSLHISIVILCLFCCTTLFATYVRLRATRP